MPATINPFGDAKPDEKMRVLKVHSASHERLDPSCQGFEWHQDTTKVYAIHKKPGRASADGTLIGQAATVDAVKQIIAAYCQGYAHGREEKGLDRKG